MSLLTLDSVCKSFGSTRIINDVSLDIEAGEKHAIIGPNGAGKSTLFHLISGRYNVSSGAIGFKGEVIHNLPPYEIARRGLARSFQVTNIFPRMSVFENIRCALLWSEGYRYSFWQLLGRQRKLNEKALDVLEQIGLSDKAQLPSGELAYAQQRALELRGVRGDVRVGQALVDLGWDSPALDVGPSGVVAGDRVDGSDADAVHRDLHRPVNVRVTRER